MRLEGAPSATGAVYNHYPNPDAPASVPLQQINGNVPARPSPPKGDCLFVCIHRAFWSWSYHYPQAWAVMNASLQAFCNDPRRNLPVPQFTYVPVDESEEPQNFEESEETDKWRAIVAAYVQEFGDDLAKPSANYKDDAYNPEGDQQRDFGHVISWVYSPPLPGDVWSRDTLPIVKRQLEAAGLWDPDLKDLVAGVENGDAGSAASLAAAPGGLWDKVKAHAVLVTKIRYVWAFGFVRDAIAEILKVAIFNWDFAFLRDWQQARVTRACGPRRDDRANAAMLYRSSGYIPRINLIQSEKHYTYQTVGARLGNDRVNVYYLRAFHFTGDAHGVQGAFPSDGNLYMAGADAKSPVAEGWIPAPSRNNMDMAARQDREREIAVAALAAAAAAARGGRGRGGGAPVGAPYAGGGVVGGGAPRPPPGGAIVPGTVRLRTFNAEDYVLDSAVLSKDQLLWAMDQMKLAHESFIEHKASRVGYGRIMLMVDQVNTLAAGAPPVSTGQAAGRSRVNNTQALRRLLARDGDAETTERLKAVYVEKRQEMHDAEGERNRRRAAGASKDDILAASKDIRPALLTADGFNQAVLLIVNTEFFFEHAAGGWVALFAWFAKLRALHGAEGYKVLEGKGTKLMELIHPETVGKLSHLRDKPIDRWKGLWLFLELATRLDWYANLQAAIDAADPVADWDDLGDPGTW